MSQYVRIKPLGEEQPPEKAPEPLNKHYSAEEHKLGGGRVKP